MVSRRNGTSSSTSGGRLHARRVIVVAAAVLLASVLAPALPAAAAAGEQARVTVREDQGTYTVTARFTIPQSPAAAVAVLTDYERIPRFMPDVRTSQVIERSGDHTLVEQEAVAKWMLFSKRVHLVLEVREDPNLIQFRDVCGRSFSRYEGRWHIVEHAGGAAITYELVAKPSFDVPGFLLRRLFERDAKEMIERLQSEIGTRSTRVSGADAKSVAGSPAR